MAIIGIQLDRTNPSFTKEDFTFWMPQFKSYINTDEGTSYFNKLYKLANEKIFKSIYGSDWEYAMCLCIAHYLTLIASQEQSPSGSTLAEVAGGGVTKGVLSSATVGGFSKTYDLGYTMLQEKEATFWNQTSYGSSLIALRSTKSVPTIMVVTNGKIT